jgi:hypothetical protein
MSQIAGLVSQLSRAPFIPMAAVPLNRISVTGEILSAVPYRNGQVFYCEEHDENVMVDTVSKKEDVLYIKLVSLDKMYNGEPVEYLVSEVMLKKYYTSTDREVPPMEGNYSVTAGD